MASMRERFEALANAFPAERAATLLVFLFPALLLSVRSGTNYCFLFLIILSFVEMARKRERFFADVWDNTALIYTIAMAALPVATLISQAVNLNVTGGPYDGALRFLFAVPVFLMLRQMPMRTVTVVQYGFVAGAFTTLAIALIFPPPPTIRLGTYYLNEIHFGDLALALGILAVLTINWDRKDPIWLIALKVAACLAAVWISIQTGTRGGWLAVPAVVVVWLFLVRRRLSLRVRLSVAATTGLALILIYLLNPDVHGRIALLLDELRKIETVKDSSIGARIQIWSAAFHLWTQYPLFGIGPDQFGLYVPDLFLAGYLSPYAVGYARSEVHNEILNRAVTLGIPGIAAIMMIYFVPFALFVRAARSDDHVKRVAGRIGACFVAAFFVFGLTVETFDLKATTTFYSLTVAVLLAAATRIEDSSRPQRAAPAAALAA